MTDGADDAALGPELAGLRGDAPAISQVLRSVLEQLTVLHARSGAHGGLGPAAIDVSRGALHAALRPAPTDAQSAAYVSPEAVIGAPATPAGDLYSLAATAYHLVSGRPPASAADRLAARDRGARDPLFDISAERVLQASFGLDFLDALMAGLELDANERPASAQAWSGDFGWPKASDTPRIGAPPLEAAPSPGRAPPPASAPPQRSGAPPSAPQARADYGLEPERRPWGRWAAAGMLLTTILGAGIWLILTTSAPRAGDEGEQVVEAETEAPEAGPPRASDDNAAWVRALEQDTLEGYRAYLEAFPDGRFAAEAQAEIDRYDDEAWAQAESRATLAAYDQYLEDWPDGRYASQAREKADAIRSAQAAAAADAAERAAEEANDWAQAAAADTAESYTGYLRKHPTGPNAAEARARRDRLVAQAADASAFAQAEAVGTARSYAAYLADFPSGAFRMDAIAALDRLRPAPGRAFQDCSACPTMVTLPAGTAQLGAPATDPDASPAEGPGRPVTFGTIFAVAETEVTFNDWQACVSAGGCRAISADNGWGRGTRPVINVTWQDASGYAAWLSSATGYSYRLPSEAEWEYAARGGETRRFPGGTAAAVCAIANGAGQESGLAWSNTACADPAPDQTLPAGSLLANGFGLKDMLGNVAEWTLDCNTLNLRDAPADGSADLRGSCNQRAVRGGSWFSGPKDLRYTSRLMLRRGDSNDFTGFRVVREFGD
ncbi:MAG: SUMF1/EgtB/PvdO family nonheme iron enzyme [Pseudomonadota bacterium]